MPVAADHSAQVSRPIVSVVIRPGGEAADSHQLVVEGQMRPPGAALLRARHVLPLSASRPEPVIATADDLGAVFEHDPVGRLDR
jgi:hypothetical protein